MSNYLGIHEYLLYIEHVILFRLKIARRILISFLVKKLKECVEYHIKSYTCNILYYCGGRLIQLVIRKKPYYDVAKRKIYFRVCIHTVYVCSNLELINLIAKSLIYNKNQLTNWIYII